MIRNTFSCRSLYRRRSRWRRCCRRRRRRRRTYRSKQQQGVTRQREKDREREWGSSFCWTRVCGTCTCRIDRGRS